MGRLALSWAGLLVVALGSRPGPVSAAERGAPSRWRTVCTLSGDDLSFASATIESGRAPRDVERVHADHATVLIEVDGAQARVRAHATAPFDFIVTTKDFSGASLSLRSGARAGVVTAKVEGAVALEGVTADGRAMTVRAGGLIVGGLPLRCEELVATLTQRYWMVGAMSHQATGLRRIFAAPDAGTGFAVQSSGPVIVSASDPARGDWRQIKYFGYVGGKDGFQVDGWVRGGRFSKADGQGGGGGRADPGFRSCARGTPARMGFATLPVGAALFESSSGGKAWATLTAPVRALVALYPRDRAALAGLPGWQWPRSSCEIAWVDPEGLLLETSRSAPVPAAE